MPDTQPTTHPARDATALPEPALALWLLDQARQHGAVLAILRSQGRLNRIASIAQVAASTIEIIVMPPLDVPPYERTPSSAAAIGQRAMAVAALANSVTTPRLLLTSATAVLPRVIPPTTHDVMTLEQGAVMDLDQFRLDLAQAGYHWDERVDEPGEVALRGQTIDLFPAAAASPIRLELTGDQPPRIEMLQLFDPLTQRSTGQTLRQVLLHRSIDQPLADDEIQELAAQMANPDEPAAPDDPQPSQPAPTERRISLFSLVHNCPAYLDAEVTERWSDAHEGIVDAYEAGRIARRRQPTAPWLPKPAHLYLTPAQAEAGLQNRKRLQPPPDLATPLPTPTQLADLIRLVQDMPADSAIVVATPQDPAALATSLTRRNLPAHHAQTWQDATQPGLHVLQLDIRDGIRQGDFCLIPIGPLLKQRASSTVGKPALGSPQDLRLDDIVVHLDHGVTRLTDLRTVDGEDRLALEFADGAELLVPTTDLGRIWRYGNDGTPVPLDRIGGDAWHQRRAVLEAEIAQTAQDLAAAAALRAAATAPVIQATPAANALNRRFPYPLTPGQRAAIEAVAGDLGSGRPMNRLICGDVGFGKTEVALRAAALAAAAGHQVLVAAPTTVLARQHLDVFQRRFQGSGIRVEGLIRGANTPAGRATSRAIRRNEVHIAVGTQGLAGITCANLGLAIIDEEQRFGEDVKARFLAPHTLVMTATPIPRTLQSALVGLRDVSVIDTPPARRQSTRSFVLPWDGPTVRSALLRERRRGGQSFIVCPRIGDLTAMQSELKQLAPELGISVAHGRLKPETLEEAVQTFADGDGDVLLATNIIEAGLDIPRANLMIVTGAERFGLAQLHQLRGRVGRGSRQGTVYFLTTPGARLAPPTARRLKLMETLSSLGMGAQVAAADLELRGGGDLFGQRQAGHVRLVGTALYQHLLRQAIAASRGERPPPPAPELNIGLNGRIPADYVPETSIRLDLYRRLADIPDLEDFAAEIEDRFGPPPAEMLTLLAMSRLRHLCAHHGISRIDAGPQGIAIMPPIQLGSGTVRDGRLIIPEAIADPAARLQAVTGLLLTE